MSTETVNVAAFDEFAAGPGCRDLTCRDKVSWMLGLTDFKRVGRAEPMADLIGTRSICFAVATRTLDAAVREAAALQVPMAVAVADRAGNLVVYPMDGAPLLSGQIAQDKAYTVAAFGLPTHEWFEMIKDEPPLLHGIVKTERLIVFGGGVPILVDGQLVGAVGVSGGSADQDRRIAEAAVDVIGSRP